MNAQWMFLRSSIGRKYMVALTGLGLAGFTLMHMSANMLILFSPETYNKYSHNLVSNKALLYGGEAGLLLFFIVHVYLAAKLTLENRRAQDLRPGPKPSAEGKAARFGSRSMILTGLLVFVFLVLHLWTFKYGTYYSITYDGVQMRDLHRLVIEKFQEPLYVGWYVFSLILLWVHLNHGLSSLLQSVGVASVRHSAIKQAGAVFAILIAGGFLTQPLYVFFTGGR